MSLQNDSFGHNLKIQHVTSKDVIKHTFYKGSGLTHFEVCIFLAYSEICVYISNISYSCKVISVWIQILLFS